MHHHHGIPDLTCAAQNREIDEWQIGSGVPAISGVAAAWMVAAWRLVVGIILLDELWGVGRKRVHYTSGAAVKSGTVVFGALRRHLLKHPVAIVRIIVGIEIAVGRTSVYVVHRRGDSHFYARITGCGIDGESSETADAEYADTFRIHVRLNRQKIDGCGEILGIDVG